MSPALSRFAVRNGVVAALLLAGCYEEGPQVCPNGANEPIADTLIGARVEGRAVLVPRSRDASVAEFYHNVGGESIYLLGTRTEDSPPQSLEVYISDFHGTGSYPVGAAGPSDWVFVIYSCSYTPSPHDPGGVHDRIEYWSKDEGYPGDSVRVTQWDSLSGRVRGTFSYHSSDQHGHPVEITDGAFDFTASLH